MSTKDSNAAGFFEGLALRIAGRWGTNARKANRLGEWISSDKLGRERVLGVAEKKLEDWIAECVEGAYAQKWALIARVELGEAEKAVRALKVTFGSEAISGLEDFVLSEGVGYRHGMARTVSEMFGYKAAPESWQKPGEYEADARAYSGLDSVDGALGDVALTALNAKLVRRYCDLRLGTWPAIEKPVEGSLDWKARDGWLEFAGGLETWRPQGTLAGEPTLEYLAQAFGQEARNAAGQFWWGTEVLDFSERVAALSAERNKPGSPVEMDIPMRKGAVRAISNLRSAWAEMAKTERAKTMGLIDELAKSKPKIADAAREALIAKPSPVASWESAETAALMFGFGWRGDRVGEPEQEDASGLREHGAELQKMADGAVLAKTVGRLCEMALGRWPWDSGLGNAKNPVDLMRFASFDRPWLEEVFVDGRLVEEPLRPREPSLGMMCRVCGSAAIEALSGLAWGGYAMDRFASRWRQSKNQSPLNQWGFPSGGLREGGPMEQAALAVGVPAYALGLEPVPAERWIQAGRQELLGRCPDKVWGGFEGQRAMWGAVAKARREEISEARLSASYSDDPSCRRSEAEQCNRWDQVVDAREALLDALARCRLPSGDPYKMDADQLKTAIATIERCEGDWKEAPRKDKSGRQDLAVFDKLSIELGAGADWPSNAKQLAGMLPSLMEAREIGESMPSSSEQCAMPAKSKRL